MNIPHSLLGYLGWTNWIGLAAALVLFLGPGFALFTFFPGRHRFTRTQAAALALGLSISSWSVLLSWLQALRLAVNPILVFSIFSAGWVVGVVRAYPDWRIPRRDWGEWIRRHASAIALWLVLLLTAAVALAGLRHIVVGAGSDSYHHSLIAQMIIDRGMLPDNYGPYAPLTTFTYHFGFHATVAAMAWLTGLSAVPLVPVVGQIFMAAAALSVAFFTQVLFHNRYATLASAAIVGLASVFPAYFADWGRYTELTGLVLLSLFLGLIWDWIETHYPRESIPVIALLAAGIALVHYRVVFMATLGVLVFLGLAFARRLGWQAWERIIVQQSSAAALAGLLIAPWLWHVLSARQQGYPVDVGSAGPGVFSLERLGVATVFATNNVLALLVLIAVGLGIWHRERGVISLSLWSALMVFLSGPQFLGAFMDTVSVVISLFVPAAIIISWIVVLIDRPGSRYRLAQVGMGALLAVLCARGSYGIAYAITPDLAYVQSDDLQAMEWIKNNTPTSARFMVNTYHWDFLPTYIIGSDAGYWLPLLAKRDSVVPPMVYSFERSISQDLNSHLVALDRLGGHLTSPEAVAALQREGATNVYIGQRGGPIAVEELLQSPMFKLQYQSGAAYVFSFLGAQ